MRGTHHHIVATSQRTPFQRARIARLPQRQRGTFAIMTALLVVVLIAFCGLAIDLGRIINRKVELQTVTESIALVAARELNGTPAGVTRAANFASQLASNIYYNYNNSSIDWSDDAIRFGSSPYGDIWLDETEAVKPNNARSMFYVRVDTSQFSVSPGEVALSLLRVLPSIGSSIDVSGIATAGRSSINAMPLAICAMSEQRGEQRGSELMEYGFRRGVNYDLMQLNPTSSTKGAHYLINPTALAGTTGGSMLGKLDIVRPFVCTGKLGIPSLTGGNITVEAGFPLESVYEQLNSRFSASTSGCNSTTAPPDTNVKEFTASSEFGWMKEPPENQSAESATKTTTTGAKLLTIADLDAADIPAGATPDKLGPLWVYAKAVKYTSYTTLGPTEPSGGYTPFNPTDTDWGTLYKPAPKIKSGASYPGLASSNKRRVLNIPLLRCQASTASSATAEVLGIAKFFMTVKAKEKQLYAEFAGVLPQTSLSGEVELYP